MIERFKRYLEEQFREIAPTKAAMQYRISVLQKMLDRAQELRIKGMNDEDLIYNTVISELGNFSDTLHEFENKLVKRTVNRRLALIGIIFSISWTLALVLSFLIVGFVTHIWHPTWLIIVGGLLLAGAASLSALAARQQKRGHFLALRVTVGGIIVLLSVFIFLMLQLVGKLPLSYLTFLAMVAVIPVSDSVIAFVSGSKAKWIELPLSVEAVCVMLYVILGISLSAKGVYIWHPGWIMCLGGVVVAIVELIVLIAKHTNKHEKEVAAENTAVDESYWSKWE